MLHKYDSKIFGARLGVVVVRWKYWWVLMVWVGEIDFIIIFYITARWELYLNLFIKYSFT
jgi:hypothetical protein